MNTTVVDEGTAASSALRWTSFEPTRDPIGILPTGPGLVRWHDHPGVHQAIVRDIRGWFVESRSDLIEPSGGNRPPAWSQPDPTSLLRLIGATPRPSALGVGRPRKISDPRDAPTGWGLYRIGKADQTWYVGITSNLRVRLGQHRRNGLLELGAGDRVEILPARTAQPNIPVFWVDLQLAERQHIKNLQAGGLTVLNTTRGGNGRPPAFPVDLGAAGRRDLKSSGNPVVEAPRDGHLDLGLTRLTPECDWVLWLSQDDVICEHPGEHSESKVPVGEWSAAQLAERYRSRHARELAPDLLEKARRELPDWVCDTNVGSGGLCWSRPSVVVDCTTTREDGLVPEPSIEELEARRTGLYEQLAEVGDFRRGSVSVNYRRCGRPTCACASPEHRGHGPQGEAQSRFRR